MEIEIVVQGLSFPRESVQGRPLANLRFLTFSERQAHTWPLIVDWDSADSVKGTLRIKPRSMAVMLP